MNRQIRLIFWCSAIAAICFAIVSYYEFCSGRTGQGWLFAALAAAQLAIAGGNAKKMRREAEKTDGRGGL